MLRYAAISIWRSQHRAEEQCLAAVPCWKFRACSTWPSPASLVGLLYSEVRSVQLNHRGSAKKRGVRGVSSYSLNNRNRQSSWRWIIVGKVTSWHSWGARAGCNPEAEGWRGSELLRVRWSSPWASYHTGAHRDVWWTRETHSSLESPFLLIA